jgi:hypothetical protein
MKLLTFMYDTTQIPSKHLPLTASFDELGEYGSIYASDGDREIPTPLNLYDPTDPETKVSK